MHRVNLNSTSCVSSSNNADGSGEEKQQSNEKEHTPQLNPTTTIQSVQPTTISCITKINNRLALLPAYPSLDQASDTDRENHFLFPNTPRQLLTPEQKYLYENCDHFPSSFQFIDESINSNFSSFFVKLYRDLFVDLSRRLHINNATIDYNYQRLRKCFDLMTHERIGYGLQKNTLSDGDVLPIHEYAVALEFFLQIDRSIFFMKTCSFRGSMIHLSSNFHGIFSLTEPYGCHGMTACQKLNCHFCSPPSDVSNRIRKYQSPVKFSSIQEHQFLSGYRSILNCPVTCETKSILYALTCPCGQYDYIGYTSMTLGQRLKYHREHGNRIIHEFILGPENITLIRKVPKSFEELVKDNMLLYKHSARCPVAMQLFLDCNPKYWPFIPMLKQEAQQDNQFYRLQESIHMNSKGSTTTHSETRSDRAAGSCMNDLPPFPSDKYAFSVRQSAEQFQYFKQIQDKYFPNFNVDLYNATIIAVLPDNCSTPLFRLLEALFVTHAQTNLNTLGHLECIDLKQKKVNNSEQIRSKLDIITDRGDWCRNLQRP
ncbi:unnamed protein product [Adineta steineri]|uniref:GIY-YIG domain-containing protein n=1 Tax=Adineta steineri TaxID=433720 RepID=A0A815EX61_9BILA|nr:unnamed protein product [Adineta steineri]CAF3554424.1 unnamed protein product [Adineta steineri]